MDMYNKPLKSMHNTMNVHTIVLIFIHNQDFWTSY